MFQKCELLVILTVISSGLLFKEHTSKHKKDPYPCEKYTSQLISLFKLVCGNLQDGINECIRCFSLASRANNNQPLLAEYISCSQIYLEDSRYADCIQNIIEAAPFYNGQCVAGYCNFVRCLRRVNSDLLIAACYAMAMENNSAELEADQIILYKDITSCILAMTRCSSINPITGQSQTNRLVVTSYDKWGNPTKTTIPLYNSLQINTAGDIRIIGFPGNTKISQYFCAFDFNLMESSWQNYTC